MKMIPARETAIQYLEEAEKMNPGRWVPHSILVGKAASQIAKNIDGLNPDTAEVLGLMHDIGRRAGIHDMVHSYTGYCFMMEQGYPDAARICITHSFPMVETGEFIPNWDGTAEQLDFVRRYLESIEYNDYDRLILLCDALTQWQGYTLIEKRLVDVAFRRGFSTYMLPRWKKIFEVKEEFEARLGKSIYHFLPGVVENTFGFELSQEP